MLSLTTLEICFYFVLVSGFISLGIHVFKGSMNQFQWLPTGVRGMGSRHMWWMFRNDTPRHFRPVAKSFVYLREEPFFAGSGFIIRIGKWSVQGGFGKELDRSAWSRELNVPVDQIREGVNGVWEEEDYIA